MEKEHHNKYGETKTADILLHNRLYFGHVDRTEHVEVKEKRCVSIVIPTIPITIMHYGSKYTLCNVKLNIFLLRLFMCANLLLMEYVVADLLYS
jgi:hypothetical protein